MLEENVRSERKYIPIYRRSNQLDVVHMLDLLPHPSVRSF